MDSLGHVKPSMLSRTLPLTAVFLDDLRQCVRHWALISWAAIAIALTTLWFVGVGGRSTGEGSAVDKAMDPRHSVENGAAVSISSYERDGYNGQRGDAANANYVQQPQVAPTGSPNWQPAGTNGRLPDSTGYVQPQPTQTATRAPLYWQSMRPNLRALTAAEFGGWIIRWNLLVFGTLAIALGATAISAEQELLADAILCRGVGRFQYFAGKCAARALAAATLFALLALPTLGVASLRMYNDLSLKGSFIAVGAGSSVMAAITALAVAGGAWFRHAIIAVAVMWMGVYGAGVLIAILDLGDLSVFTFCDRCTYLLRGYLENLPEHKLPNWSAIAACAAATVSFACFNFRDI